MRLPSTARFFLLSCVVVLGCRRSAPVGQGNSRTDARTDARATAPAASGAATTAAPTATTGGTEHVVNMIGDSRGYRFEPLNLEIRPGDKVRFVLVSGGPHNIAFDTAGVPASAKARLAENTSSQMGNFIGPMMISPDEAYIVSFAGLPPGTYRFYCMPHLAMNQRGSITVR